MTSTLLAFVLALPSATFVRGVAGDADGGFRESWHTHQGLVALQGIRQKPPHVRMRWRSAPVPATLASPRVTFVWTGALGAGSSGPGGFTISVNGHPAADFDVAVEPTRFISRADGCEFLYDVSWVFWNGLDSSGHFFLTVPASWLKPGEPAVIEVEGKDASAHRWFALLRRDDAPLAIPERAWAKFVRRPRPALPPPADEEASYEWYLPQYRDPGIFTTIGPPGDPAEVAVSPAGQLFYSNEACHGRSGVAAGRPPLMRNALAFALAEGESVSTLGARGTIEQELLDGFLPIVRTRFRQGDLEIVETSFAEPLGGADYETGLERTLAWAGFDIANRASASRDIAFLAFHTGSGSDPRPVLVPSGSAVLLEGTALFSLQAPHGFRIAFDPEIRAGGALVARGSVEAGATVRLVANRVFDFPGTMHWGSAPQPPVAAEAIANRSFDEGLRRVHERWLSLARGISRFETPDGVLDNIYRKAMLDGYFLTKRWNGRSIVFDSVSYRCQWDDASTKWFYALDLLGDHATSARLLDTVFARQGERKPAGTRTREGCFSDVTNTTGDGSPASWTSCNGWALWAMAEHARLSGDRAWLAAHKRAILDGSAWIIRERSFSKEDPANPCAGLIRGKFVCDLPDDSAVSGVGYFTYTDAISYMGLAGAARILKEWGHAEGTKLLDGAERYKSDIIVAIDRLTDRSRDPWYVPWVLHAPKHESRYFYDVCGPINLGGVLPRDDERIGHVIRWIIDRTHGGSLESAAAGVDGPTEGAMFYSQDLAVTLLELGRVEEFLRIFYALLAANVSHETLTTCEWMGNTQPHIHSIGSLIRMFRTMVLQERDGALYLLQGVPRRWLEQGREIRIREAPTWYGPLSLRSISRIEEGRVRIEMRIPERIGGTPIHLKLRLPREFALTAARIGDAPLDVRGEWIVLRGRTGEIEVNAEIERPPRRP